MQPSRVVLGVDLDKINKPDYSDPKVVHHKEQFDQWLLENYEKTKSSSSSSSSSFISTSTEIEEEMEDDILRRTLNENMDKNASMMIKKYDCKRNKETREFKLNDNLQF